MIRKILFMAGLFYLVAQNFPFRAACPVSKSIVNTSQPMATSLDGTPSNVYGRMWVFGNGASVNSGAARQAQPGGADCANVGTTPEPYWDFSGCTGGTNPYGVYADAFNATAWANGCPANTDRIVILLEDTSARYAIISKIGSAGTWDLDQVPTQAASAPTFTITRTSAPNADPLVFDVNLSNLPANGNGGYAPGDGAPSSPLITGYELYYQNSASVPSNLYSGSWTLCGNGVISGATTTTQTGVTAAKPGPGTNMYLLLRPTFESGYKSLYGVLYTGFPPTPAGVFASCEASLAKGQVTVTWRTNVETGTARFVVETSKNENGPFTEVAGTETEPKGNYAFYTAAFPNPYPGAKKFFVRVKSADFDGKEYFSNTVKITRKTAKRYGQEIFLDDGE
jgi:hypothetical protein